MNDYLIIIIYRIAHHNIISSVKQILRYIYYAGL